MKVLDHKSYRGYPYSYAPVRSEELLSMAMLQGQLLNEYVDLKRLERGLPPFYAADDTSPDDSSDESLNRTSSPALDREEFGEWVRAKLGLLRITTGAQE